MTAGFAFVRSSVAAATPVALWLASAAVCADYQDGLDAYAFGDYARAMAEWQAVVSSPSDEVNPAIFAEAHYAIAKLYWLGAGVEQDYRQAYQWLLKAAELDHSAAQAKLGFLYTDGRAVPQDFNEALAWYSRAAKAGNVDGLYNLGIFYLYGWGVEQNPTMAAQYLATASALGDAASEEALQEVLTMIAEGRAPRPPAEIAVDWGPELETEGSLDDAPGSPDPDQVAMVPETAGHSPEDASGGAAAPQSPWRDEAWIRAQNPDHYTIQVMALSDLDLLRKQTDGFESLAPFAIYTVQKGTSPLHVLVQGSYGDVDAARAAQNAFPRKIQKRDKLWIRRFEMVQRRLE